MSVWTPQPPLFGVKSVLRSSAQRLSRKSGERHLRGWRRNEAHKWRREQVSRNKRATGTGLRILTKMANLRRSCQFAPFARRFFSPASFISKSDSCHGGNLRVFRNHQHQITGDFTGLSSGGNIIYGEQHFHHAGREKSRVHLRARLHFVSAFGLVQQHD